MVGPRKGVSVELVKGMEVLMEDSHGQVVEDAPFSGGLWVDGLFVGVHC